MASAPSSRFALRLGTRGRSCLLLCGAWVVVESRVAGLLPTASLYLADPADATLLPTLPWRVKSWHVGWRLREKRFRAKAELRTEPVPFFAPAIEVLANTQAQHPLCTGTTLAAAGIVVRMCPAKQVVKRARFPANRQFNESW